MKTCFAKKNHVVRNSKREKDAKNAREGKRSLKLTVVSE
jgi:hypothetical protein